MLPRSDVRPVGAVWTGPASSPQWRCATDPVAARAGLGEDTCLLAPGVSLGTEPGPGGPSPGGPCVKQDGAGGPCLAEIRSEPRMGAHWDDDRGQLLPNPNPETLASLGHAALTGVSQQQMRIKQWKILMINLFNGL